VLFRSWLPLRRRASQNNHPQITQISQIICVIGVICGWPCLELKPHYDFPTYDLGNLTRSLS
jgi:hypothetical protein